MQDPLRDDERSTSGRIGWTEYVTLPEWGIRRLHAKMDTGARTSAIHVGDLQEIGRNRVRFAVVLNRSRPERRTYVTARIVRRGRVRSSNGQYELRVFVRTRVRIGALERDVELSLVDRQQMVFRLLLGRTALHGLLVDVNHRNLLGSPRGARSQRVRS